MSWNPVETVVWDRIAAVCMEGAPTHDFVIKGRRVIKVFVVLSTVTPKSDACPCRQEEARCPRGEDRPGLGTGCTNENGSETHRKAARGCE